MKKETRQSDRVSAQLPVQVEEGPAGVTRNISPGGVYFIVDENLQPGQTIHFAIEFSAPGHPGGALHLNCIGEVVRVVEEAGKRGVAVKISQSKLERRDTASGEKPASTAAPA